VDSSTDREPGKADVFAELAALGNRLAGALDDAAPAGGDPLQPGQWAWDPQTDALALAPDLAAALPVATGEAWLNRIHPDDRARHREAMLAHLDGLADRFECASRMLAADGAYRWMFTTGVALRNPVGRAEKLIGSARPLSGGAGEGGGALESVLGEVWLSGVAALEAREREKASRLAAEAATRSQREFLATVSHEIRNPLGVIFAYSQIMKEAAEEGRDPDLSRRLSKIDRAGRHLLELVNNVLDLAKLEAGKVETELRDFDLEELLAEVAEMGEALAQRGANRFVLETAPALGVMRSDRLKLRQVLLNLVGNACKFTEGGSVTLAARPDPEAPDGLLLEVRDTGIGIPADRLGRLFQAFSQADAAVARQRGGTGLGLFICDRYCRLLGGAISVESEQGRGSSFAVRLPRRAEARAPDAAAPRPVGQVLVIGYTEELTSLDPHHTMRQTDFALALHCFDALVRRDAESRVMPGLATHWEPLGEGGWRFHLRPGVRFHDGAPFDAEDVLATFRRLPRLSGAVPYAGMIRRIREARAPDPMTLDLLTDGPHPLLPNDLGNIGILQRRFEHAPREAFDGLEAMVGTGAFRPLAWQRGQSIRYAAFGDHWAGPPPWPELELRLIDDELVSVGALLAGEVHIIDNVSPSLLPELRRNPEVRLWSCTTNRLWYLFLDQWRDRSPYVTDRDGRPLERNPLKDQRVRRAISLALDRAFLTRRLSEGQAVPAGDIAPPHVFGADPERRPDPYDPARAKALLAEAGWPEGFAVTLHGSRDRSYNGAKALRAIALMLSGIGIACRAEALPSTEFYGRAAKGEFSLALSGWGSVTGETGYSLRLLLGTRNEATGFGMANRGGYANPAFDALVADAIRCLDDSRREALLRQAASLALEDVALVPVSYRITSWATRRGLSYRPQADGSTFAWLVLPEAAP
jgi:peptide/nickel transport system substrate-binding protein